MNHPNEQTLNEYVSGLLDVPACVQIEAHTNECDLCAHKLYLLARAEVAMHELARAPLVSRTRWPIAAVAAAVLLALSFVSYGVLTSAPKSVTVDLGDVICPDGDDQGECVRQAHAHGRYVRYPAYAGGPAHGERYTQ